MENKQQFDPDLMENLGRPLYFDIDHYLDSVEQMICADELNFAFEMLDNVPGWYRDNPPARLTKIKSNIYRQLMDVSDYVNDSSELDLMSDREVIENKIFTLFCAPRGPMITTEVFDLNEKGIKPIIIEFGPADFWLPIGLGAKCNLNFDYFPITINQKALAKAKELYPQINWITEKQIKNGEYFGEKRPIIFVCFEVIEHMNNPKEMTEVLIKHNITPDIVLVSTPMYTMGGGLPNWSTRPLGHIRTYTPKDLFRLVDKLFSGMKWNSVQSISQVVIGKRQ